MVSTQMINEIALFIYITVISDLALLPIVHCTL